jgi:hypothetical protein
MLQLLCDLLGHSRTQQQQQQRRQVLVLVQVLA